MQVQKEKDVSGAFFSYLSSTGVFEDWEKNKEGFRRVHVSPSSQILSNIRLTKTREIIH